MIPDLGSYATYVLGAYAGSLILLVAICWLTIARARAVRRALQEAETRLKDAGA